MSSYEDLMCVVDGGAFQCRPDCFAECLPDECPAHRQAIKQYEAVVQRLVSAEEAARKLQEENQVLKKAHKNWRLERAKLIKLLPIETSRELPGPSQSPTSPAKKRRADSPGKGGLQEGMYIFCLSIQALLAFAYFFTHGIHLILK
ncbi:hypothetical protein CDAR_377961 [Caerostris darwini]|uniref:Uncharacterized protein n=1 Tax=Caerostris darwini TaxID=1538125 RepID=A0AAV4SHK0_9ARAC|nr:hypothetical protein CDAR_377961 [Caerostris darwini]